MTTDKKTTNFKPINVLKKDWEEYNQLALMLSMERGERVSIPAVIREAVNKYAQSL